MPQVKISLLKLFGFIELIELLGLLPINIDQCLGNVRFCNEAFMYNERNSFSPKGAQMIQEGKKVNCTHSLLV